MLGSEVSRVLSKDPRYRVYATTQRGTPPAFTAHHPITTIVNVNAGSDEDLMRALIVAQPDVIVNCIGVIKQKEREYNSVAAIAINALLPHRLAELAHVARARLIHISTDCVFSGRTGNYSESDRADADDLYGRTKYLGEVLAPHVLTLRTSIIGHELGTRHGLVEWFLGAEGTVSGYPHAIFSGLPTVEFARVLADHVLPRKSTSGLFHVSSASVAKLDLLRLIKEQYGVPTRIVPDPSVRIDRSLRSGKFQERFSYHPPTWPQLVARMHAAAMQRDTEHSRSC